ncbi:MAG: helix-turn-helix transcriptional regulator [Lachnospira sp.]
MDIKYKFDNGYNIKQDFIDELPVMRARAKLSQKDVADAIGISRQTYNCIETGKRETSITTILALVAFFQNNTKTEDMVCEVMKQKQ